MPSGSDRAGDADRALRRVERITAVGATIGGLEMLRIGSAYADDGINSWPITRTRLRRLTPPFGAIVDAAVRHPNVLVVAGVRAASGAVLLLPGIGRVARGVALAGAVGSGALLHLRTNYGNDGSDHLAVVSFWSALAEKAFGDDRRAREAALGFIAAQSALSYLTSGLTKLRSPIWRSGDALSGVLRTRTYGDPDLYALIRDRPRLRLLASWGVMLFEVAFPLALVLPTRLSRTLLAGAAIFHVLNARYMGLNRFLWSFAGSYPAVDHVAGLLRPALATGAARLVPMARTRSGALAAIAVGIGATAAVVAAVARRRRARPVPAAPGRMVALADGDVHVRIRGDAPGPVVLLESALATPCTAWTHVVDALVDELTTVAYDRVGNGWTAQGAPVDVASTLARATAVLDATAPGRRAIVVGHSVGGLLALLAAARDPGRIAGIVLVDSSHPEELERSSTQRDGLPLVGQGLHAMLRRTLRGERVPESELGAIAHLPEAEREATIALLRGPSAWRGALAELRAWEPGWNAAARHATVPADIPLAVVTAGRQASVDSEHRRMQADLAARSTTSTHVTVEGAEHDGVVLEAEPARAVADAIRWVAARIDERDAA